MKFETIASSSKGNAYRLSSGRSTLLIECGIGYKELQKAFDFKLSQIDGVLVSHEHIDHARSVLDVAKHGLPVYLSHGTKNALNIKHHNIKGIDEFQLLKIGEFNILPFGVKHDSEEPFGFLIADQEGNKMVFVTDSYYIPYRFNGLTHIAVECNFSEEILEENILGGIVPIAMRKRLQRSHFSLENVKEFLQANDLKKVQEIHLLHLSDNNSDESYFKDEIQRVSGKPVYIAKS